jgi:betaine-aldehyde dehydrogenase
MKTYDKLYIGGHWVAPSGRGSFDVFDSSTEEVIARIPAGDATDVGRAVQSARAAFAGWSSISARERADYLQKIQAGLAARGQEIAQTIANEVGMPLALSTMIQAGLPTLTFGAAAQIVRDYRLEEEIGNSVVVKEPAGVVGCITPWNYPLHQVAAKVAPALAAGCTVVLKPSEVAPISAFLLAEVIDAVGLPAGVFNLVSGDGPTVGEAIVDHGDVDMVSFTGSTRAGKRVA